MKILARVLLGLLALILMIALSALGWLYFTPPETVRVANAYSAKTVCSSVFVSGRKLDEVFADDVQAPGHWILKYVRVSQVGSDQIDAALLGVFGRESAVYRPGLGCASAPDHDVARARAVQLSPASVAEPASEFEWPLGDEVSRDPDPRAMALLNDPKLAGPGMRAMVVVKDNRIVAERYGAGFNADTPLLGWSMTKTVIASLVAARIRDGQLGWDKDHLFDDWSDGRAAIKIADLMSMTSGLALQESYGDVNDVTRMLFLEPDQAGFVRTKPLEDKPGERFNYTTGTGVALARILMDTFGDKQAALAYPRKALFGPIGMRSAVLETDEAGTFSGGSLMYATARDWARFGLLLANGGDWNGDQILPEDVITRMQTPTAQSGGRYTQALTWKSGTGDEAADATGLPADAFWALGHDGQALAVAPSEKLVVVRLGLTPSSLNYDPTPLVKALIEAIREPLPEPEPEPAQ